MTDAEPAKTASIVFRLLAPIVKTLEMLKMTLSGRVVGCDVDDQKVEHGDQGEAFVQLGERQQYPGFLVEPDGKEVEEGEYGWKEDDSDDPGDRGQSSTRRKITCGHTVSVPEVSPNSRDVQ